LKFDTISVADAISTFPKETCTHLALSALSALSTKQPHVPPTIKALTGEAQTLLGVGVQLPEDWIYAVGEMCVFPMQRSFKHNKYPPRYSAWAPSAELPNTAAFLGGLVAQETIKMITSQYVPVKGYCVVDLVDTWTGAVG
jgi:NEDD8-activating enzyme E1 regulatory subunit